MFERYPDLELQLHLAHFDPISLPCHDGARDAAIKRFKARLPLDQLEIIYVHGIADGHPFLALEDWLASKSGRQLIFLEDDLYALHRLVSTSWGQQVLTHPQVHLRFLHSPVDGILEECARDFPSERVAVTVLGKKKSTFSSIKLALLRKTVLWSSVTSEILSGHLLHRNILSNLQKLPKSFYVNSTKGAFKGQPAVICGAGPSLSGIADQLKVLREKALLIGCGSALSALSHLQIRPHLGMAIDPNAREKECLRGCHYRDLPLIYGNRLYPEVFEFFDGPYGYLRSPTGSALEKAIEEDLGLSDLDIGLDLGREALSVTTLALSLACFWGCSPIILAGVDLAYRGKSHYAKGVPVHLSQQTQETRAGEQVVYRKGAEGKRVATMIKWIMEKHTIDSYTKWYPGISFINATGKGLGFSSIPYRSSSEIESLISHARPIEPDLEKMISQNASRISNERLKASFKRFYRSFQHCLNLARMLQEEAEESGKAILYQDELSQEIAYQLTLRPAMATLEKVWRLNLEIPFSRNRWKYLEEIAEEYLKLFSHA